VRKTIGNGVNELENQAVDSRVKGEHGRRPSAVKVDNTVRKRNLPADWIRPNASGRMHQAECIRPNGSGRNWLDRLDLTD
jgi:hypothetical protein